MSNQLNIRQVIFNLKKVLWMIRGNMASSVSACHSRGQTTCVNQSPNPQTDYKTFECQISHIVVKCEIWNTPNILVKNHHRNDFL